MPPVTFLASPTSSPSLQPTILSTLEKAQRCLHLDSQYLRAVTVEDHVRRCWIRVLLSPTFRKEIHGDTDHLFSLLAFHDPRVDMCYILEPTQRCLPPCWRLLTPEQTCITSLNQCNVSSIPFDGVRGRRRLSSRYTDVRVVSYSPPSPSGFQNRCNIPPKTMYV